MMKKWDPVWRLYDKMRGITWSIQIVEKDSAPHIIYDGKILI